MNGEGSWNKANDSSKSPSHEQSWIRDKAKVKKTEEPSPAVPEQNVVEPIKDKAGEEETGEEKPDLDE